MGVSRWFFDLTYLLGRSPWDTQITPPEVVELIEGTRAVGRALDLGCGTGTNCIYLAQRGWDTVGVDFSYLAVLAARRKARQAGAMCRFHRADVTNMPFLTQPFDLVLDIGCLHSVSPGKRARYVAEATRLTRPGGLYMLYAFAPCDGSSGRGITPQEVRHLLAPTFAFEREERGADPSGPAAAWYWLRRGGVSAS